MGGAGESQGGARLDTRIETEPCQETMEMDILAEILREVSVGYESAGITEEAAGNGDLVRLAVCQRRIRRNQEHGDSGYRRKQIDGCSAGGFGEAL